jgi:hypothetical protein
MVMMIMVKEIFLAMSSTWNMLEEVLARSEG